MQQGVWRQSHLLASPRVINLFNRVGNDSGSVAHTLRARGAVMLFQVAFRFQQLANRLGRRGRRGSGFLPFQRKTGAVILTQR